MVVDLKSYKLAKILTKDLKILIAHYEDLLIDVTNKQVKLNKWQMYKSPNLVSYKLEEFKFELQKELYKLKAAFKAQTGVIDESRRKG